MQDLHSIHTHRREAAIPFPLNPPAGSGQNLLNLLNPATQWLYISNFIFIISHVFYRVSKEELP